MGLNSTDSGNKRHNYEFDRVRKGPQPALLRCLYQGSAKSIEKEHIYDYPVIIDNEGENEEKETGKQLSDESTQMGCWLWIILRKGTLGQNDIWRVHDMKKIESLKDLIMILLYARGHTGEQSQPIQGRTRLMKMVFIFKKELLDKINKDKIISDEALPEFDAYNFGPFSAQVYTDLEFLIGMDFVNVNNIGTEPAYAEESMEYKEWTKAAGGDENDLGQMHVQEFRLSSRGRGFVTDMLFDTLSPEQWRLIDEFKSRCTESTLRSLLRYVYTKYSDYTTESKIRDAILTEYQY